jgi:predicted RNA binding protein YcfA (HicA-like mRNA interferase family)
LKRHELLRHLERNGWKLHREGSRHSIYLNSGDGAKASVPRHAEIDNRLAGKIYRQLSIPRFDDGFGPWD